MLLSASPARAETTLRVMNFNICGGGNDGKGIGESVAAIRASNPDIVGIQAIMPEGRTAPQTPAS